jgi:hypothetical protein
MSSKKHKVPEALLTNYKKAKDLFSDNSLLKRLTNLLTKNVLIY